MTTKQKRIQNRDAQRRFRANINETQRDAKRQYERDYAKQHRTKRRIQIRDAKRRYRANMNETQRDAQRKYQREYAQRQRDAQRMCQCDESK